MLFAAEIFAAEGYSCSIANKLSVNFDVVIVNDCPHCRRLASHTCASLKVSNPSYRCLVCLRGFVRSRQCRSSRRDSRQQEPGAAISPTCIITAVSKIVVLVKQQQCHRQ